MTLMKKKMYVNFPEKYVMKPNKCSRVIKSGKRKGEPCSKSCYFKYCGLCSKKKEKTLKLNNLKQNNHLLCSSILKTGKNKGKKCGKVCKDSIDKCGIHNKMKDNS